MDLLIAAASLGAGAAVSALALSRPPAALLRPPHVRSNFRGSTIPATMGILLVVTLAAGVVAVASLGPAALIALIALIALTAASEVVSFTRVIDHVAPLRALDRLRRLPPPNEQQPS